MEARLSPGFGPQAVTALLSEYAGRGDLMLVGHEPDFSRTIGELTGGARVVMKKGGLARLDLAGGGHERWELVWLLPPKLLTM